QTAAIQSANIPTKVNAAKKIPNAPMSPSLLLVQLRVFNPPATSLFLACSPSVEPQSLSLDVGAVAGGSGGSLPDAPDQEYRGRKGQRGEHELFEENPVPSLVGDS